MAVDDCISIWLIFACEDSFVSPTHTPQMQIIEVEVVEVEVDREKEKKEAHVN